MDIRTADLLGRDLIAYCRQIRPISQQTCAIGLLPGSIGAANRSFGRNFPLALQKIIRSV
jgi:hypothetical protein